MEEKSSKMRPYWHVDLKWVTGILLIISLTSSVALYNISKLMAPKVAVDVATLAVATAFSGGDLDKTSDLEEAKKKFPPDAEGKIHPMPQIPEVFVLKSDLDTLPPREIRLKIFRQVVEPIYYRGSDPKASIAGINNDEEAMQKLGLLSFLNEKNYNKIKNITSISFLITLVILALFVFFSAGAGRFVNPGLVLIFVGAPGIFLSIVLKGPEKKAIGVSGQPENMAQMLSGTMNLIGPEISGIILKPYLYLLVSGFALIVLGLISKFVNVRKKSND